MNPRMSSRFREEQLREEGRAIARGMDEVVIQKEKNMATAEKRRNTMLENAAERALSGNNSN